MESRAVVQSERFVIHRQIGEGGLGVVYEAFDKERRERVALKTLSRLDAAGIYRIKREFRALADVVHPNLVRLYELVSDGDQWFFTMELVLGRSFIDHVRPAIGHRDPPPVSGIDRLQETIEDGGPSFAEMATVPVEGLTDDHRVSSAIRVRVHGAELGSPFKEPELRSALAQLARGISAIHAAGKLHRDLKPSNVMVDESGRLMVLDFGLVGEAQPKKSDHSLDEGISGTPAYMAPEQARGGRITQACDWYSLGVMLYEALTGTLPFEGSIMDVLRAKQKTDPIAPERIAPDVPADLASLCNDLLRRDPVERPSEREILSRIGLAPLSLPSAPNVTLAARAPFVGRAGELAQLRAAFETTLARKPVTVYLHGVSGIGKSALVRKFLEDVHSSDAVVLAGRCYERESVPFKAFDSIVDALTLRLAKLPADQVAELLPRDAASIARVFPVMQRVPAIARAPRPSGEVPDLHELRRRAFGALKELLARMADRKPLIVYVDDLQWGDADSAALFGELLRPPDPPAMLFIASYRTDEVAGSPFLRTLLSEHRAGMRGVEVHDLALQPLPREQAVELALELSGEPCEELMRRAERIAQEAEGNPFFLSELVRHVAARELASGSRHSLSGEELTLESVLLQRLNGLAEEPRRLLELVAVAGQPIEQGLALSAADLAERGDSALAVLRVESLVRSRGTRENDPVECYHDRIRQIVADSLTPSARQARHLSLAERLEQTAEANPVALTEHFRAAGEHQRAARYAEQAADRAAHLLAFDDAARLYRLSLELQELEVGRRAELSAKLGDALANAGRPLEAARAYLEAAPHVPRGSSLELRRRAAEQLLVSGHIDEGIEAVRGVLEAVGMKIAPTPRRALLSLVGRRLRVKLRGLSFQRRDESEVSAADLVRIDTCWSVAAGLSMVDTIRAADFQARHLLLALGAGEPYRIARALAVEAGFAATPGGPGRKPATKLVAAARTLADEIGHPHALGLAMMTSGMAAYLMGEWKRGLEHCSEAERILSDHCSGVMWELTSARRFALSSLGYLGELGELGRRAPPLLAAARERGNLYAETDLRTRLMHLVWLAADAPEEADDNARDALERWSQTGFHLQHYSELLARTHADLYRGDGHAARQRVAEVWDRLSGSLLPRIQVLRVEGWYLRGRAELAAHRAGTKADLGEVLRDARRIEAEQMPWATPLAELLRAGVCACKSDFPRALAHIGAAHAGFETAEMGLCAAAALHRWGELEAGDAGAARRARAVRWLEARGVVRPDKMVALYAPGFDA